MTQPRSQLIALASTPYYHCISRCVRRAFLCGDDHYSGNNYDHRKPWMLERLKLLSDVFCIDIAAYAIMNNHYHLVLHVDRQRAQSLSDQQVIARWMALYQGPVLIHRLKENPQVLSPAEHQQAQSIIDRCLCKISWFMGCLNEHIARMANQEDHCTGHFWESRFKSQALLDHTTLLSCMAYVDLNPVRANITNSLITSDFTSIQDRLQHIQGCIDDSKPRLMPFVEVEVIDQTFEAIPFNLKDYIELVDWTGRVVRKDKRGAIPALAQQALEQLGVSGDQWQHLALQVQQQSLALVHGLDEIARSERRLKKSA